MAIWDRNEQKETFPIWRKKKKKRIFKHSCNSETWRTLQKFCLFQIMPAYQCVWGMRDVQCYSRKWQASLFGRVTATLSSKHEGKLLPSHLIKVKKNRSLASAMLTHTVRQFRAGFDGYIHVMAHLTSWELPRYPCSNLLWQFMTRPGWVYVEVCGITCPHGCLLFRL